MGLDSFIEKGGGAALPRSVPARRDKEQAKRMRGQSSHASWKSEAEMVLLLQSVLFCAQECSGWTLTQPCRSQVLRQQYDS